MGECEARLRPAVQVPDPEVTAVDKTEPGRVHRTKLGIHSDVVARGGHCLRLERLVLKRGEDLKV